MKRPNYLVPLLLMLLGFMITGASVAALSRLTAPTKVAREYPALCIDPFASADLGQQVFTWCKLVPMWSMKV